MTQFEVKARNGQIGYINVVDLDAFILADGNEEIPVSFEQIHGDYSTSFIRKDQLSYIGVVS